MSRGGRRAGSGRKAIREPQTAVSEALMIAVELLAVLRQARAVVLYESNPIAVHGVLTYAARQAGLLGMRIKRRLEAAAEGQGAS